MNLERLKTRKTAIMIALAVVGAAAIFAGPSQAESLRGEVAEYVATQAGSEHAVTKDRADSQGRHAAMGLLLGMMSRQCDDIDGKLRVKVSTDTQLDALCVCSWGKMSFTGANNGKQLEMTVKATVPWASIEAASSH